MSVLWDLDSFICARSIDSRLDEPVLFFCVLAMVDDQPVDLRRFRDFFPPTAIDESSYPLVMTHISIVMLVITRGYGDDLDDFPHQKNQSLPILPIWNEHCNDDPQATSAFHHSTTTSEEVLTCSWHCEQRLNGFLAPQAPISCSAMGVSQVPQWLVPRQNPMATLNCNFQ